MIYQDNCCASGLANVSQVLIGVDKDDITNNDVIDLMGRKQAIKNFPLENFSKPAYCPNVLLSAKQRISLRKQLNQHLWCGIKVRRMKSGKVVVLYPKFKVEL